MASKKKGQLIRNPSFFLSQNNLISRSSLSIDVQNHNFSLKIIAIYKKMVHTINRVRYFSFCPKVMVQIGGYRYRATAKNTAVFF